MKTSTGNAQASPSFRDRLEASSRRGAAIVGVILSIGFTAVLPSVASTQNVIEPGQEDLLIDMLGKGETLPGPCKLTGAEVKHTILLSTYGCPSGEVVYALTHPSEAPSGAVKTAQFAVAVKSGTPPDGLTEALASRVRAKEVGFHWKDLGPPPSAGSTWMIAIFAAAGLAVAAGVAVLLLRRRPSPR